MGIKNSPVLTWPCVLPLVLRGCAHNVIALFGAEPYTSASQTSMVFDHSELSQIDFNSSNVLVTDATSRNKVIIGRMYLLDQAYFDYETRFTHDDQFIDALGSLATFSTSAVAAAIPLAQATKTLSAVSAGVTSGVSMYQKDVLMSQTMQALQNQMRTDRDNRAAIIFARMQCPYAQYPAALAYSDLEEYARAGTLSSALLGLTKTTSQAQTQAQTAKNTRPRPQTPEEKVRPKANR